MSEVAVGGGSDERHVLSRRMDKMFPFQERYNRNDERIRQIAGNAYHPIKNRKGIVNLATAFSYVCEDLMSDKLSDPALYRWDDQSVWHVTMAQGTPRFRESLARFYSDTFQPANRIDPNDLIVINGVTSCLDYLAHCIADPGDVILIPVPAYAYLCRNVKLRAEVDFWPVDLWSREDHREKDDATLFRLTAHLIEDTIKEALNAGKIVRGLLIVNPNNPLGDVYPRELIYEILEVCCRYSIHAILDEILALCVFEDGVRFQSAVTYASVPDPERTHVIWSMSKDFSFAGARMAVVHTRSKQVGECLRRLGPFYHPPLLMQVVCQRILDDRTWCDRVYFPTFVDRLRTGYVLVTRRLTAMGVKVRPAVSGFVLMAYFGPFLKAATFQAEDDFFQHLLEAGVYMTPGHVMFCSEPGWARIVFSQPEHILEEGLERIENALRSLSRT